MCVTVSAIVLKVASRCNLNCAYCYLYNHEDRSALRQPKRISDRVFDALLSRMADQADRQGHPMSLTLHGGEPTLLGRERLEELIVRARERLGASLSGISLQTNGTLIDGEFADMLSRQGISVGVSLDGPPELHDRARVTHAGAGSHADVVRGIRALHGSAVAVSLLCVVSPGNDGAAAYRHFRSLGVKSMDFLLPDVSHDNRRRFYGTAAHPVADYLLPVLDAWLEEDDAQVRVAIFWDLLGRMMGSRRTLSDCFGSPAATYVVVNTDGSIEPLDALKVCADGITSTPLNVLTHSFHDIAGEDGLLARLLAGSIEPAPECQRCSFFSICGGGFLPHRYARKNGFANPSVWCEDIKILLGRLSTEVAAFGPLAELPEATAA